MAATLMYQETPMGIKLFSFLSFVSRICIAADHESEHAI